MPIVPSLLLAALSVLPAPEDPDSDELVRDYAVVVHPDNPRKSVDRSQLDKILQAKQQFWKGGKRIYLILPKSGSAEKNYLLAEVYGMTEVELKRYWLELVFQNKIPEVPKVLPSVGVTLAVIGKRPEAIGVVLSSAVPKEAKVRILPVDGKLPGTKGYPLREVIRRQKREGEGGDAICRRENPTVQPAEASFTASDEDETQGDEQASPSPSPSPSTQERLAELERLVDELQERADDNIDDTGFDLGPLLNIRGFTDVTYRLTDIDYDGPTEDVSSDAFALGQFDLFLTSQLSERLSALNETVFTAKSDGSNRPNIERAIIKYNVSDSLNVQAGRFHTTLGHWNEAYHHGEWFHTTIGRPQIVNFGGSGGILPIHLIGVIAKGRAEVGTGLLDYTLELGNGRGATRGPDQVATDLNDPKAVNVALGYSPAALDGLRFGGGVYVDDIPPNADAADGPLHGTLDETILSAFATLRRGEWEFLAEWFQLDHEGSGSDPDSTSDGYYIQASRTLGDWTPYARFEGIDIDDATTFFEDRDDLMRYLVGCRWDFSTWSALKAQVMRSEFEAPAGGEDRSETALLFQWSYAF